MANQQPSAPPPSPAAPTRPQGAPVTMAQRPPAAPAPPADPRTTELSSKLLAHFPGTRSDYVKARRFKVTLPSQAIAEACTFLRDELGFDHILAVSGTDYIAKKEIEVIYFVGSLKPGQQDLVAAIAERTPRDAPSVPSLVSVWPGAEYHERETFEMLGVKFDGHPDMRGILLPEDWHDIPPLRKDFISPGR